MYIDGYVLAVKKDRLTDYRALAEKAAAKFKDWGAISVVEAVEDDVPYGQITSFPRAVLREDDEIVVFSYVTYPSREVRDSVWKKISEDPDMQASMSDMPFDGKRMILGGFTPILEA